MNRSFALQALCVLAILSSGYPVMATMQQEDALIARHLEWLGGRQALGRVQTFAATGTLSTAGLEGTLAERRTSAGWWRRETRLGAISILEVRGASGGWTVNWSGQVEPLGAAPLAVGDRENAFSLGRHLIRDAGAQRADLGVEARDGRDWRVVRFRFPDGDFFDLFLDGETGACTWIRERQDTRTSWLRLSDWRLVSGVRIPFERQTFHDDPELDSTVRWTTVEINGEMPAGDFDPPQPRRSSFQIADGASSTPWIPVELIEGRYVFVTGRVQGREVSMLLDSGANTSVVDDRFARAAGIESAGRLLMSGTSRSQQAAVAVGVAVEVGTLRLSDLTVVVTDLSSVDDALGYPVPFILGKEAFNSLVVEIDYPASRLSFTDPAAFRPDPAVHPLALVAGEGGGKLVELSVEGLPSALFALDTGSGSAITLFKSYVEEHRLLAERSPRSERLLRGIGGGSAVTVATLRAVTIAGFTLEGVPAEFFGDEQGAFHTVRAAGNLGAGVLSRFRVAFDYSRSSMYLTPGPEWQRPWCKNRVGLDADFRGSFLEVVFVSPGSPASRAGWVPGQRVVAIDHRPIAADFLTGDAAHWWCGQPGTTVVLTDAEGRDRELAFADYY